MAPHDQLTHHLDPTNHDMRAMYAAKMTYGASKFHYDTSKMPYDVGCMTRSNMFKSQDLSSHLKNEDSNVIHFPNMTGVGYPYSAYDIQAMTTASVSEM